MRLIRLNKEDSATPWWLHLTHDYTPTRPDTAHQPWVRDRARDTDSARLVNDSAQATTSFVLSVAKCDLSSWGFVLQCTMENLKGWGGHSFQELNKQFWEHFGPFLPGWECLRHIFHTISLEECFWSHQEILEIASWKHAVGVRLVSLSAVIYCASTRFHPVMEFIRGLSLSGLLC